MPGGGGVVGGIGSTKVTVAEKPVETTLESLLKSTRTFAVELVKSVGDVPHIIETGSSLSKSTTLSYLQGDENSRENALKAIRTTWNIDEYYQGNLYMQYDSLSVSCYFHFILYILGMIDISLLY